MEKPSFYKNPILNRDFNSPPIGEPIGIHSLRLMGKIFILTGQRLGELAGYTWHSVKENIRERHFNFTLFNYNRMTVDQRRRFLAMHRELPTQSSKDPS